MQRKVKKPQITVKPREVFYQLKRSRRLGSLDEESIEEILNQAKPHQLTDPGCLYENFSTADFEADDLKNAAFKGNVVTVALATVGDRGLGAALMSGGANQDDPRRRVLAGWGEAMLAKLTDFTNGLVEKEAAGESLELGPVYVLDRPDDAALIGRLWGRLSPEEKLGVRRENDPAGSAMPRIDPVLTKMWAVGWLTKKQKKQLTASLERAAPSA
ncbi:MAG: hypothetical protein HYT79_01405 [Elusimicrobia bacterium]|nr:hypothetical protein [Elusimicrobiota bacterium]